MLKFDIQTLLKLSGATRKMAFLHNRGITRSKAQHLIKKDVKRITISDIEKLCRIFNCTPNELFTFEESSDKPLPPESALKQLVREPIPTIPEILSGLSAKKSAELINKLIEIKNQK